MGKIPISYKAYNNGYRIPMGICLSLGVSLLLSGLFNGETSILVVGIIGIALFFVFKYLNYARAKEEAEENLKARMDYFKKEVESVLNNMEWNNQEKISKIIEFSNEGNVYATLFLKELSKERQ